MTDSTIPPATQNAPVPERPDEQATEQHVGQQPRGFLVWFVVAWFGINLATGAIGGAALPKLCAFLFEATKAETYSLIAALGGVAVIIATPLFGRLSDRTMSRLGRRRPWILGGALVGAAGSVVLGFSHQLWLVVLGWLVVQCGFGSTNAAVHALLAEQIPKRIRAQVAGFTGASAGLALILGTVLVASMPNGAQWAWFVVPGCVGALLAGNLFFVLHDVVRTQPPEPWRWSDLVGTYWLNPRRYRDFFWAWTCRLLVTMAIVTVSTYLLFFIIDHFGVPREIASSVQANTMIAFTLGNIVMTVLMGWVSDRTGRRKPIIWISCALSAIGLAVAITAPGVPVFMLGIAIVGAAQGAFISVDVALMTEVPPSFEDAGKDLGIVALSYQLPQVLVPVLAAQLLHLGGGQNYLALYLAAIVFAVLGGLAILPVRGVR